MKTNWIASKISSLLPMIMAAVLTLTIMGCEKEVPIVPGDTLAPAANYSGNIMTKTFWVSPEGANVDLFNGDVSLEFQEGTVTVPTEFTLSSFPLHHLELDDHNTYNRGFSLNGNSMDQNFMNSIKICIRYDLSQENWTKNVPIYPGSISILNVSPTLYAYERVVSIGDCRTDFSCMRITGCIGGCGFYVIGEN